MISKIKRKIKKSIKEKIKKDRLIKTANKNKTKILLVYIANTNFGDTIIADCSKALIKEAADYISDQHYEILDYSFKAGDLSQIPYVDAIIFAGGGLIKFKNENFYHRIAEIIEIAEKNNIPVFFNDVGVEGYDEEDERCQELKAALNQSCVKGITVRDDMETLKDHYLNDASKRVASVLDPAAFCRDIYGNKINSKKTSVIGIGIARSDLFVDYGHPEVDHDVLLSLWIDTIRLLEEKGYTWKLFTNGLDSDEAFAQEILDVLGYGEKVPVSKDCLELVNNIHSFDSIIACRMHANIIAYSLQIPSIGLAWNDKLSMWGQKIGYPERFLTANELAAEKLVAALEKARKEGCKKPGFLKKYALLKELRYFMVHHAKPDLGKKESVDMKSSLLATALGGYKYLYRNTNSLEALEQSLSSGYQNFEADVRISYDEKLVLVNGWSKNTFEKLGIPYTDDLKQGLTYEEFLGLRYNNRLTPFSFEDFLKKMKQVVDKEVKKTGETQKKIVLDIGLPPETLRETFMKELVRELKASKISKDIIYVRFQRRPDVAAFLKLKYNCNLIYVLPKMKEGDDPAARYADNLAYCKKQNIRILSMTDKEYTPEIKKMLEENDMKACIFTYRDTEPLIQAVKDGAAFVGSYYNSPDFYKNLFA